LGLQKEAITLVIARADYKLRKTMLREEKREIKSIMRRVQSAYASGYIQLYRQNLIDDRQLMQNLLSIGYLEQFAKAITQSEHMKKLVRRIEAEVRTHATEQKRIQTEYRRAYVEMFRKNIIDEKQLENFLTQIALTPTEIDAILKYEVARKYTPPTVFE